MYKLIYKKKRHESGARVCANWVHDHDGLFWYPGRVVSYETRPPLDPKYGNRRSYSIKFDDGCADGNIPEELVMSEDDYYFQADDKLNRKIARLGFTSETDKKSKVCLSNLLFSSFYIGEEERFSN